MRFVVIGLGSMGKRRIRCLQALGFGEITGCDGRSDRRRECESLYGVKTVSRMDDVDLATVEALIISTPPDHHLEYIQLAVAANIPAFVEASVIREGLVVVNRKATEKGVLIAPSCTLKFHPAIKTIKEIVEDQRYGKFTNFSYHSGQYLPDWHPWEKVADYYVSQRKTGGGREIVPFELTWLVDLFGYPVGIKGFYGRTMDLGADIDDTYALALKFEGGMGTLLIDVVARYAVRSLVLNFEQAQLLWKWDEPAIRIFESEKQGWQDCFYQAGEAASGYNKNISEQMYIDEMQSFLGAVTGRGNFPNSLAEDIRILGLLEWAEQGNE